jgi:deoxyadenosine/deoxycytidine kinase
MLAIAQSNHTIVQDRSIFEGVYVFVTNNYRRGDLTQRDYDTYMELFEHMKSLMRMPDLMIYLRKSVPALIEQIQKRGREYEQGMQIDYLKDLNDRYEEFIYHHYEGRVLVIDSDHMNFEQNPEDFRYIVNRIDAELFGLFSQEMWKQETANH